MDYILHIAKLYYFTYVFTSSSFFITTNTLQSLQLTKTFKLILPVYMIYILPDDL